MGWVDWEGMVGWRVVALHDQSQGRAQVILESRVNHESSQFFFFFSYFVPKKTGL